MFEGAWAGQTNKQTTTPKKTPKQNPPNPNQPRPCVMCSKRSFSSFSLVSQHQRKPAHTRNSAHIYFLAQYTRCSAIINEKFVWQDLPCNSHVIPNSSSKHLLKALHVPGSMQLCNPLLDATCGLREAKVQRGREAGVPGDKVFNSSNICWGSDRCQAPCQVLEIQSKYYRVLALKRSQSGHWLTFRMYWKKAKYKTLEMLLSRRGCVQ